MKNSCLIQLFRLVRDLDEHYHILWILSRVFGNILNRLSRTKIQAYFTGSPPFTSSGRFGRQ